MACDCATIVVNQLPEGTTIEEGCCPGPEIQMCYYDADGSLLARSLRRLRNVANPGLGYEWFDLTGTAIAEPAAHASYVACPSLTPLTVAWADGPGVSPDNSAGFVVDATPTLVFVTDGPTGAIEIWWIRQDVAGDWQWSQIA